MRLKTARIFLATALLALVTTPAWAHPCDHHGKGTPHFCYPDSDGGNPLPPDNDSAEPRMTFYHVYGQPVLADPHKSVTVTAQCDPSDSATGPDYISGTEQAGVVIPQRVYVSTLGPMWDPNANQAEAAPIGEIGIFINGSVKKVWVTVGATCASYTE